MKLEKYSIIGCIFLINIILSVLAIIYNKYWYIFLLILASSSSMSCINTLLIIFNKTIQKIFTTKQKEIEIPINDKIVYIMPCYNETYIELNNTIESIVNQKNNYNNTRYLIIICDGKILPPNDKTKDTKDTKDTKAKKETTDKILLNLLREYIISHYVFEKAYKTWNDDWMDLELFYGNYKNCSFIILIKSTNLGKRDSLTLIRRLLNYNNLECNRNIETKNSNTKIIEDKFSNQYNFSIEIQNNKNEIKMLECYEYFCPEFLYLFQTLLNNENRANNTDRANNIIKFIIGTDADTILEEQCTDKLIQCYYEKNGNGCNNLVGIVGIVNINNLDSYFNPLIYYQYYEYFFAQCLRRNMQSKITNKVNCLSGCIQLLKICNETCGDEILKIFNHKPTNEDKIINKIRGYASEDRNHVSLMFQLYPYIQTIQCLDAICFTHVPNNMMTFLKQRKRWFLGSIVNDLLLIKNSNHVVWERINSLSNVLIQLSTPFVFIMTIGFMISIIMNPTLLMLQLSTIIIIPMMYGLIIPFLYKSSIINLWFYWLGMISYYTWGGILNIIIFIYTTYYLDDYNWNNRRIENQIAEQIDNDSLQSNNGGIINRIIKIWNNSVFGLLFRQKQNSDIQVQDNYIEDDYIEHYPSQNKITLPNLHILESNTDYNDYTDYTEDHAFWSM